MVAENARWEAAIPLSLYIHLPWCVRKCPYCDFNSHAARDAVPESQYVAAVLRDLELELPQVWGRRVATLFVGGGTPSLFSGEAVERLLSGVRARLPVLPGLEVTLEANPGTVDAVRFAEYRAAGVNRLSLGIQSFDPESLQRLGRIHGPAEALAAVELAHRAGFDNLNLDLMFGLPGQTLAAARVDLATAIALAPAHISYYQLTIEPNTAFHRSPPAVPEEELIWRMQQEAVERLSAGGYAQYEVSAYARAQRRCRHNLNYWEFGDYLGIGAGAHGKLTGAAGVARRWKVRHPRLYLEGVGAGTHIGGDAVVAEEELPLEFAMNALRLKEGFPLGLFGERTGLAVQHLEGPLAQARERGLVDQDGTWLRPTATGWRFLNELLELFVKG